MRFIGLWFGLTLLAAAAAAQSPPLDLRQVLQAAESSNLEVRAARQQRAISLAGLITARQFPNPTVSFGAARDTPHESVVYDQPFELGGKRSKRISVATEEQRAAEIDITALSRQVRRRARESFFRVLFSRAATEQSKSALDLASRLTNVVQQRFDLGDVAELEVIQTGVELARARAEYEITAQLEKGADAQLAALLARPLEQKLTIEGRLEELPKGITLEQVTQAALGSNPDLQRAAQALQLEQSRLALAKSARIPNIDIQVGTDLNAPPDFNVGPRGQIAVTLPLFYHGQGEVAQSTAKLEFIRLSLQAQKTNTAVQVLVAYYDYLAKLGQAEQYAQKIVPQTIKLEEMAEDSYRSGKSNLLLVIDAQRKLNETRRTYLENLFAVHSSFAALEEVVGAPID